MRVASIAARKASRKASGDGYGFPMSSWALTLIAIAFNDARFYLWVGSNLLFESLTGLFDAVIVAWIIYFGTGV